MSTFQCGINKIEAIEPHGLEYCRRNGLSTKFEMDRWTRLPQTSGDREELLVVGNVVVWTVGQSLQKAFDFTSEGQEVRQALFAYFPTPEALFETNGGPIIPRLGLNSQMQSPQYDVHNAFKSTSNVAHIQANYGHGKRQRALVIILEELAYVYHDDGRRDSVNLPFIVRKAYPLQVGIILERTIDPLEFPPFFRHRLGDVPTLFSLRDPLDPIGIAVPLSGTRRIGLSSRVCYVDDNYLITYDILEKQADLWTIEKTGADQPESGPNSNTNAQARRRRSSMHASTSASIKSENLEVDIQRPSTHSDQFHHLDRFPTADVDPSMYINEPNALRKDVLLSHIGVAKGVKSLPSSIVLIRGSDFMEHLYMLTPEDQNIHEFRFTKSGSSFWTMKLLRRIKAREMVDVQIYDNDYAFILLSSTTYMLRSPESPDIHVNCGFPVIGLYPTGNTAICLMTTEQTIWHCQVAPYHTHPLVERVLSLIRDSTSITAYKVFCAALLQTQHWKKAGDQSEFDALCVTILSCFLSPGQNWRSPFEADLRVDLDFTVMQYVSIADDLCRKYDVFPLRKYLPQIFVILHTLAEELALSILTSKSRNRIIPVLLQLANWLEWEPYLEYYSKDLTAGKDIALDEPLEYLRCSCPRDYPVSVTEWAFMLLDGRITTFPGSDILLTVGPDQLIKNTDRTFEELHYPKLHAIGKIFTALADASRTLHDVVDLMTGIGFTQALLDNLPRALALPLQDMIRQCASKPSPHWSYQTLDFIGRKDLSSFLKSIGPVSNIPYNEKQGLSQDGVVVKASESHGFETSMEHDRASLIALIFNQDRRVQEVTKLLNFDKPTTVRFNAQHEQHGDAERIREQQLLVKITAFRTLAIPTGWALYDYNCHRAMPTDRYTIPKLNLDIRLKSSNIIVSADQALFSAPLTCWPVFHTGVAAGLGVSRRTQISASWIVFNRPEELDDGHAGFLLGLGLNGHLKAMASWLAFNYLTSKHTMTSVGLLLGLSASFLGSMDPRVTKLLSVHILALLPSETSELNLTVLTQSAGLVGVGLLYFGTSHRKMSDVMLKETVCQDTSTDHFRDESYRLSAGLALGMINVGTGALLSQGSDQDVHLRLMHCIDGYEGERRDLDAKVPGSIVALALIYLRTDNLRIADRLRPPETEYGQSRIRPDLFLLRALARGLILWDDIESNIEYIESELPKLHKLSAKISQVDFQVVADLIPPNIITGICLSIGIKYAGSLDEPARDLVLRYLDMYTDFVYKEDHGVLHETFLMNIRTLIGVLSFAVAMIMAGSGDLQTLRRLRRSHNRLSRTTCYGVYMAVEMSIGLLFLSRGQASLTTSNLAVCSFVAAFYPVLPNSTWDNHSHSQALRHLWALGTEPRCLILRDSMTSQARSVPVRIKYKSNRRDSLVINAPCLLPPLDIIKSIVIDSPEYWPVDLDFTQSELHIEAFRRDPSVYITKRYTPSGMPDVWTGIISGHSDTTAEKLTEDIQAALHKNSLTSSSSSLRQALTCDDDQYWDILAGHSALLSMAKDEYSRTSLLSVELIVAYWKATTIGLLAHKYSKDAHRCFDDEFVQNLQLELWRSRNRSRL